MVRRQSLPPPPADVDAAAVLAKALDHSLWSPAASEIRDLIVVPTGMHNFDLATRIGGVPVELITTVFGPSQGGKTALALAICGGFLAAGGIAAYVDAERRLRDADHIARMLGFVTPGADGRPIPLDASVWDTRFRLPPKDRDLYYEDAVEMVNRLAAESRELAAKYPWYPGAVVVIDALDTLVPKNEMADAFKDMAPTRKAAAEGITSGRLGQRIANMNASWLRLLSNLAATSRLAVVLICQETVVTEANGYKTYRPRGGDRIVFHSSLMVRVQSPTDFRTGFYGRKKSLGSGEEYIGTLHHGEITKTSLANLTAEGTRALPFSFWQSNGIGPSAPGIDWSRDLLETALQLGVVTAGGAYVSWGAERLGSFSTAHESLAADRGLYDRVLADVRAEIARRETAGITTDPEPSDG